MGEKLEPWKEVVRQLLDYHFKENNSPLRLISTEFIPATDYGAGNTYSLLSNSVACAKWIKEQIAAPFVGQMFVQPPNNYKRGYLFSRR